MLVLVPNNVYKDQDPFLMIPIPASIENSDSYQDFSLEDFQWWAYTSDFDQWFQKSGRQWKADESLDFYEMMEKLYESYNKTEQSKVVSFSQYFESSINEFVWSLNEENGSESAETVQNQDPYGDVTKEDVIKFLFAYQQLLESGNIKLTSDFKELKKGDEKCIFLGLPKNKDVPELESIGVSGFRFKVKSEVGTGKLMEYDLSYPGPVDVSKEEPLEAAGRKFSTVTSSEILGTIFAGSAVYYGAIAVGGWWSLQKANAAIKWGGNLLSGTKNANKIADAIKVTGKAKEGVGIWKGIANGAKAFYEGFLKFPYKFVKSGAEGVKSAKALNKLIKGAQAGSEAAKVVKEVSLFKTFFRFGAKGAASAGSKGAARAIPYVGWVLLGVDAVGSLINWFSDNQAPRPGEAEELFKGKLSFNASSIKDGETVTICWSQPTNSAWGTALSFLVSNIGETRTVLNMTKILGNIDNHSVFLLQSANSESLNKQIQESMMTLIAVPNDVTLEQGILDNDDFDGKICSVPKPQDGFVSPWAFRGICEWSELESAVTSASSSFFKIDPAAPKKYSWNFEDIDGNVINVTGSLVSDEDLSKLSPEELNDVFHGGISTGNVPIENKSAESDESDNEEEKVEAKEEVVAENASKVLDFDNFLNESERIYEEENERKMLYTKPVTIAIYNCSGEANKRYSNPELRGKNKPPRFTNFVVNPDDYQQEAGSPIEVLINSDEEIENPKAGLARYQEEIKSPEEDKTEDDSKKSQEEVEDKVQASDKLDASDMVKKERKRSTVIRDKDTKSGTNIAEEFLTQKDKEVLGIEGWDKITFVKEIRDKDGNVTEVKIKNRDAKFTDKSRNYEKSDGLAFEIAQKLAINSIEELDFSK